jgi:hypothetical protein
MLYVFPVPFDPIQVPLKNKGGKDLFIDCGTGFLFTWIGLLSNEFNLISVIILYKLS